MPQPDFLRSAVQPVNDYLAVILAQGQWSPKAAGAFVGLVQVAEAALFISVLSVSCAALRSATMASDGSVRRDVRGIDVPFLGAALAAFGLFYWSLRVSSPDISSLFARWDHLAFCAVAGYALSRVPLVWRKWALSAVSLYFMVHYLGALALASGMGGAMLGFVVFRSMKNAGPWSTTGAQGLILAGIYATAWMKRSGNVFDALKIGAVFSFVLLRHISFVVEARRGRSATLTDYLCYMLFYPSFIGASEIYNEFYDNNLGERANYDYKAAATKIIAGQLQFWASFQIEVSFDQVIRIEGIPWLWLNVLLLFVRSALFVMGLWATIEGVALLYGFRLRPNFAGILTCENPSQFWHAWRGTMTNWLVHYVYIPLGGNRRRQFRNIFAAFAVSTAWHCMGMPLFAKSSDLQDFVPVALWGVLNAVAVVGYVQWRQLELQLLPATTPVLVRWGTKIFLTVCLGTFTVTLLDFRPHTIALFSAFLRHLLGLG